MTESQPDRFGTDDFDGGNRDPGASVDEAGLPEAADDRTPGTGDVPEPELPSVPVDEPVEADAYGTTRLEQAAGEPLDERLAAEEPDPAQDPALFDDPPAGLDDDPELADLDEPPEPDLGEEPADLAGDGVTGLHIETEPGD